MLRKIEIVGLNKADILLALYNNARFQGKENPPTRKSMGILSVPGKIEKAKIEIGRCIKEDNYFIDYIDLGAGPRPLKVDLRGCEFDPGQYDKIHGVIGYAENVIRQLEIAILKGIVAGMEDALGESSSKEVKVEENKTKHTDTPFNLMVSRYQLLSSEQKQYLRGKTRSERHRFDIGDDLHPSTETYFNQLTKEKQDKLVTRVQQKSETSKSKVSNIKQ